MAKLNALAIVAGVILGSTLSARAAVTVFDDAPENGFGLSQRVTIDTSMAYQGSASAELSPNGPFDQIGFTGSSTTPVPADATDFQMAIYVADTVSANRVANFAFQVAGPTFSSFFFNDSNSNLWTIDGNPGTIEFSADTWHIVKFDLADAFTPAQLTPGATDMLSMYVQTNGDTPQSVIHLDSASFVSSSVPEPASISLLGAAALFALRRRRSRPADRSALA